MYVPKDFYKIIAKCNKTSPFQVVRMTSDMFVSTKALSDASTQRKVFESKDKVEWLKMQHIKVCQNAPQTIFFKYSLNNDVEFDKVSFAKRGRGRRRSALALTQLYQQQRHLSTEKLADITRLLKYVPPVHHCFYLNLRQGENDSHTSDSDLDEEETDSADTLRPESSVISSPDPVSANRRVASTSGGRRKKTTSHTPGSNLI